ncbi:MAG: AMP-binding protein, partial [Thermoleophilia bacterium]
MSEDNEGKVDQKNSGNVGDDEITGEIEVLTRAGRRFPPPPEFSEQANISSMEEYEAIYQRSVDDPEGFWAEMADEHLDWYRKWDTVLEYDFDVPEISWFKGGQINVSHNCLDRHLTSWRRNKAALIWEADDGHTVTYTYQQLAREVNRFANVLQKHGIGRGDRVSIYMPMIPELAIAMLACSRIGAIHSIVFGGFSAGSLADRIRDCSARMLITANAGMRGGRVVALKTNADEA